MSKHFAWRPHLRGDLLFNPYIPSERTPRLDRIELADAYGDDVASSENPQVAASDAPSETGEEPPKPES